MARGTNAHRREGALRALRALRASLPSGRSDQPPGKGLINLKETWPPQPAARVRPELAHRSASIFRGPAAASPSACVSPAAGQAEKAVAEAD